MFSDPIKNLKAFGLRESDIVVDLGAGTGFYSIAAAKMTPRGKVYAVDVEKDYLQTIKDKGKDERLSILNEKSGVWRCRTIFNCTDACPRGINVTKAIGEVKKLLVKRKLNP